MTALTDAVTQLQAQDTAIVAAVNDLVAEINTANEATITNLQSQLAAAGVADTDAANIVTGVTNDLSAATAKITAALNPQPAPAPAALALPPTTWSDATVGVAYTGTAQPATGGKAPYTYAIQSGALPAGLALDPATGNLSGTPTAAGSATYSVTVTDSSSPAETASQSYSLNVEAAPAA